MDDHPVEPQNDDDCSTLSIHTGSNVSFVTTNKKKYRNSWKKVSLLRRGPIKKRIDGSKMTGANTESGITIALT